jgi:riboflavin synthase
MFTGIVRERGRVVSVESGADGARQRIEAPVTVERTVVGDSVAVNGACLTATAVEGAVISFTAVPETLSRTTLGKLAASDEVNVEAALRVGDPLGGHIVQGHVDGVGRVRTTEPRGQELRVWIHAPPTILRYCVAKGSIAVEGVSLTVAELGEDAFAVALVPHTLEATTLGSLVAGREVNLEVDVLAKYVERLAVRR